MGIVVVEAARRSGSLITARFGADQGREVFAVPGSPLDPRAEGTNDLIRDGATFCADVDDVLRALADRVPARNDLFSETPSAGPPLWDELDLFPEQPRSTDSSGVAFGEVATPSFRGHLVPAAPSAAGIDEVERHPLERVVGCLGPAPVSIDELARATELPIPQVRGAILELEIAGRIERHGGGLVSLLMD